MARFASYLVETGTASSTAYQYALAVRRTTDGIDLKNSELLAAAQAEHFRSMGQVRAAWPRFVEFLRQEADVELPIEKTMVKDAVNATSVIDGKPFLYYQALYYIRNLTPKQNVSPGTCPQANIKWFCNPRSTHRLRWCDMTALRRDGKIIGISLNLPPTHEMGTARSWTEIPILDLFYAYRYLLLWAWSGERLAPDDPRMQGSVVPAEPGETEPMSPTEFETRLRRFPAREPEHARKVRELWDRYSTHVREQSGFTGL